VYLLDTNVVSELRRTRPHPGVISWLRATPGHCLHVCAVTLGELQAGAELTRRQDPAKALAIESWIDGLAGTLSVLPMDAAAFRAWARLFHGHPDHLIEDAMIAACATVNQLTVVTRNVRDFVVFGVAVLDPFKAPAD
jgi:predicted nucleic acid-binding protein